MSKVQIFAKNVKTAVVSAREAFFNAKKDGFEYRLPLKSLLPRNSVPDVAFSTVVQGGKKFARVDWL